MNNEEISNKLLRMKKQIEEARTKKASLEGRLEVLNEALIKDYKVNSVEEAIKLLEDYKNEVEILFEDLKGDVEELEGAYDWE